jgi:hypothetical protein
MAEGVYINLTFTIFILAVVFIEAGFLQVAQE